MGYMAMVCVLVLASVCQGTKIRDPCWRAYEHCDWEFLGSEGRVPSFAVNGPPDEPFTPQIVAKNPNVTIGVLNMNHLTPEVIVRRGGYVPVTSLDLERTQFKPYSIERVMGSGIGHERFQWGSKGLSMVNGRCLRVFFTTYQLLVGGFPPNVKNINVKRSDFKCVVFRAKIH